MLRPGPYARKVLVALLTIVVFRTVGVMLLASFLAGKVDLAVLAYPMVMRVPRVLLVGSIVRK